MIALLYRLSHDILSLDVDPPASCWSSSGDGVDWACVSRHQRQDGVVHKITANVEKEEGLYMNGLRNTTETYAFHVLRLHIVTHAQLTPSPDKDQQYAVETSRSTSKYHQSDNIVRQTIKQNYQ